MARTSNSLLCNIACLTIVFLFVVAVMIPDASARDLKDRPTIPLQDLPTCIIFNEPTNLQIEERLTGTITGPDGNEKKFNIKVKKGDKGFNVITAVIRLDDSFKEGRYDVNIFGDRVHNDFFTIREIPGSGGGSTDHDCKDKDVIADNIVVDDIVTYVVDDIVTYVGGDPYTHPYALHITAAVAGAAIVFSAVFLQMPTKYHGMPKKWRYVICDRTITRLVIRPITYNIVVLTTYLIGMSLVVDPGLNLLVQVMRFEVPIVKIPEYMVYLWQQIFLDDEYLSRAAHHVTHPNLYLFYAIFILPFMVGATKTLLSGAYLTKRMWFKRIIKYILKISILSIVIMTIFIFMVLNNI